VRLPARPCVTALPAATTAETEVERNGTAADGPPREIYVPQFIRLARHTQLPIFV